jgi:hypothetical protein
MGTAPGVLRKVRMAERLMTRMLAFFNMLLRMRRVFGIIFQTIQVLFLTRVIWYGKGEILGGSNEVLLEIRLDILRIYYYPSQEGTKKYSLDMDPLGR